MRSYWQETDFWQRMGEIGRFWAREEGGVFVHVQVNLANETGVVISFAYNRWLQAALYGALDSETAEFLHDFGFEEGGRRFKLFCFSRLLGHYRADTARGGLVFEGPLSLVVASPNEAFCRALASGLLKQGRLILGRQELEVSGLEVQNPVVQQNAVRLFCLSPVVAYSTFARPDGSPYTCYFEPGESDFSRIVEGNLRKKFKAFYGQEAAGEPLRIRKAGPVRQHLVRFKGGVIKGSTGVLEVSGPLELLQLAVDAGLGSKNSQGFGCVRPWRRSGGRGCEDGLHTGAL